ncbi:MAG: DUF1285 domain-containing protein [Alphaproteobacteria bacterium]|nr:DUF1285 domain-containing protein [Alphaproteobacteria bacterium SS10]
MGDQELKPSESGGEQGQKPAGKVNGKPQPREYHIRIARDGTWFHQGRPMRRMKLVKLFSTVLKRLEDGQYWLETPAERGVVEVEDAPFLAVEVSVTGSGADQELTFRTNLDQEVTAGTDYPITVAASPVTGEPTPYIAMDRGLSALINRAVYYQLAEIGEMREVDGKTLLGVMSSGEFYALGEVDALAGEG